MARKPGNPALPGREKENLPQVDPATGLLPHLPHLPPPRPAIPKPPREYVSAAMGAMLTRPTALHPSQWSQSDVEVMMKQAFNIAEIAHREECRRYDPQPEPKEPNTNGNSHET